MLQRRIRIAAYVVCPDDRGRFLLARWVRPDGARQWTLPGGGLDPGEHPEDGALRELTEETGHAGALDALLHVDALTSRYGGADGYAIRVVYRGRVTGGTLTAEADGSTDLAQWFTPDEIATLDTVSLVGIALEAARREGRPLSARRPSTPAAGAAEAPALAVHSVISRRDGRVLLAAATDGAEWDLPGGPAEHGEPLAAAASRLATEVAGVEARSEGVLAAGLDPDGTTIRITCLATTDVELPPVTAGQRWCSPDELAITPLPQVARSALAAYRKAP